MPKGGFRPGAGRKRRHAPPPTPEQLTIHASAVSEWQAAGCPRHARAGGTGSGTAFRQTLIEFKRLMASVTIDDLDQFIAWRAAQRPGV